MTDSEHELWRQAKTLEDIGELTAQWVEGRLAFYPGYGAASVDPETVPLRGFLADFNRKGFVTTFSQPAQPIDEHGYGQRASVDAYASEKIARKIAALGLHTDLLVLIFEPGGEGGYQVPISLDGYQPYTWNGGCWGYAELEPFDAVCSEEALAALRAAWRVIAIDLQWGREAHLWEEISKVLDNRHEVNDSFSITPSDAEGLGTDFIR